MIDAICKRYVPPPEHPGNRTFGKSFGRVWLTYWGHCGGHDRPRWWHSNPEHTHWIVSWHRFVLYIRQPSNRQTRSDA